jgi:hypothetical protein
MPYRAAQGGQYGGGVYPDSRPRIDVGQILDSIGGGATSLIHATMLRKQTENEAALRQGQLALEQQRESREAANQSAQLDMQKEAHRQSAIAQGFIPAHQSFDTTPNTADTSAGLTPTAPQLLPSATPPAVAPGATAPTSAIGRAFQYQGAPVGGAAPAASPAAPSRVTDVPESYDPERNAALIRGRTIQELRNEGMLGTANVRADASRDNASTRADAARDVADKRAKSAEIAKNANVQIAQIRAKSRDSSPIKRMANGNVMNTIAERTAEGLISEHGGYEGAKAYIDSDDPDAVKLRNTPNLPISWHQYLDNAHTKSINQQTKDALKAQSGANGLAPEKAVEAVQKTGRLIRGGGTAAPTPGAVAKPAITKDEKDAMVKRGAKEADILKKFTVAP